MPHADWMPACSLAQGHDFEMIGPRARLVELFAQPT
jgi:hypothetical protein